MIDKNKFAPIIIFTYNRLDSLIQTIQYLSKNIDKEYTDLIMFSDSWRNEKDKENVLNVRKYLHSVKGFKSHNIIEREVNYGLAKNIIEGVSDIINEYGRVIVLEDDLLTSKNFISYMNQALDFYEKDNRIFSISGFCWNLPSLNVLEEDVFLAYRPASWGWATWKDQWDGIDWDVTDFDEFIKDKLAVKKFNRGGMDMTRMLRMFKVAKNNSWAIRWSYAMFKKDRYCLYPKISKVQNIGFGGDATHCTGEHIHTTILDDSETIQFVFSNDVKINEKLLKEFRYQNSYLNKAIKKITIKLNNLLKGK